MDLISWKRLNSCSSFLFYFPMFVFSDIKGSLSIVSSARGFQANIHIARVPLCRFVFWCRQFIYRQFNIGSGSRVKDPEPNHDKYRNGSGRRVYHDRR